MKEFCFICNPSANRSRAGKDIDYIKSRISGWPDTTVFVTQSRKELKKVTAWAAGEYEVVVACGGDGTVSDIASEVCKEDNTDRCALGIIPIGSGNDFIKSAGIPRDLDQALALLKRKKTRQVDLVKCNHHYFINTMGFGFDGLANRFATRIKALGGGMKYFWAAMKANMVRESFSYQLTLDDGRITRSGEAMMITLANGKVEGGSFIIAPEATLQDGRINLIIIDPISRSILPFYLPLFLVGKGSLLKKLHHYSAQKVGLRIENNDKPIAIHADGEEVTSYEREYTVEVLASAIRLIC